MKIGPCVRFVSFVIGCTSAALSAYGAYEMQLNIEKMMNYLVVAAPFVVIASAALPPIAESLWSVEHKLKSGMIWLAVIPAATLAFFAALERVHYSKEAMFAEQRAIVAQRDRLKNEDLVQARKETSDEIEKKDKAFALKQCKKECQEKWQKSVDEAKKRETFVLSAIMAQEAKIVNKPEVTAPMWLLPATLDVLGFVGVFIAFAPNSKKEEQKVETKIVRRKRRKVRKPKVSSKVKKVVKTTANDNVHYLNPDQSK